LRVPPALGLESTTSLFTTDQALLHTTSVIRYPVLIGPDLANYRGRSPEPTKSKLLMSIVEDLLVPELASLNGALIVPMGRAVANTLRAIGVGAGRCLYGFPHPSGANGHAPKQFAANFPAMRAVIAAQAS